MTRNFESERGEIDLVCRHADALVFVEVKSRADVETTRPSDAIGLAKENALLHAAQYYLQLLKRDDVPYRFDVVEVHLKSGEVPTCTLLENFYGGRVEYVK